MKKTRLNQLLIIILIFVFSGCASILNTKLQKVSIVLPPQSSLLVDAHKPREKKGKYLLQRDLFAKQITLIQPGYKEEYHSLIQFRKSPLYALSIVPFSALFLIPAFYDNLDKSRDYLRKVDYSHEMTALPDKNQFNRMIGFNDLQFTMKPDSLSSRRHIQYRKYLKNGAVNRSSRDNTADFKSDLENLDMTQYFDSLLIQKQYISHSSNPATFTVSAQVERLQAKQIGSYFEQSWSTYSTFGQMMTVNLGVKWIVSDIGGNPVFSYHTTNQSGEFAFTSSEKRTSAIQQSIADGMEYGFIELTKSPAFQALVKQPGGTEMAVNTTEIPGTPNLLPADPVSTFPVNWISEDSKGNDIYLSKNGYQFRVFNEFLQPDKKMVLELLKDNPQIALFAEAEMHKGNGFMSALVNCYNDMLLHPDAKFDRDYRYQFGLLTKKEYKSGPNEELLKVKRPISGQMEQLTIVTTRIDYTGRQVGAITTSDNFRLIFQYGNAEFKKGFLLKNLRKAIQSDPEALKYLDKYRRKKIFRYTLGAVGLGIIGVALHMADGDNADATPFVAIPGVVILAIPLRADRSYKTEYVSKAIETYNRNLAR